MIASDQGGARLAARPPLSLRTRGALLAGRAAAGLSRRLGRGRGSVVGGKVTTFLDPGALRALAAGRTLLVVTGTNGKSTTARLLTDALRTRGPVALNDTGSNMDEGLVAALDRHRTTDVGVLEVDEAYLGPVLKATRPRVVVLMNLSREYTRGVTISKTLRHWRESLAAIDWPCTVVANVDDPLVAWAAEAAADVVPVAAGLLWADDAAACRGCGSRLRWDGPRWSCPTCGRARPEPVWSLNGTSVRGPAGDLALTLALPGRATRAAGLFALAAASLLDVPPEKSAAALEQVSGVDGRYFPYPVGPDHRASLLVVKNPAGWREAVEVARTGTDPVVFALEPFGPKDTATMWDAPVELLAGRRFGCAGRRRYDVAAWLETGEAEVDLFDDALEAVRAQRPGLVVLVVNYSGFRKMRVRLGA